MFSISIIGILVYQAITIALHFSHSMLAPLLSIGAIAVAIYVDWTKNDYVISFTPGKTKFIGEDLAQQIKFFLIFLLPASIVAEGSVRQIAIIETGLEWGLHVAVIFAMCVWSMMMFLKHIRI